METINSFSLEADSAPASEEIHVSHNSFLQLSGSLDLQFPHFLFTGLSTLKIETIIRKAYKLHFLTHFTPGYTISHYSGEVLTLGVTQDPIAAAGLDRAGAPSSGVSLTCMMRRTR